MRWFVEISKLGANPSTAAATTFCVEAPQWQPALQAARQLRGDNGALSGFSIELLDDGYRAIDPASRIRYVVRRAPDDAALSNGTAVAAPPAPASAVAAAAPKPLPPRRAQTVAFASKGAAIVQPPKKTAPEKAAAPAAPPVPQPHRTKQYGSSGTASVRQPEPKRAADAPPTAKPPSFQVLTTREEAPSAKSPLTYREYVYAVAPGTSEEAATRLLRDRFTEVKRSLEQLRPGKLVNLAVFDHVFQGRPQRRPIATLTWKDWRSSEPDIRYPARTGVETRASPSGAPSAPPAASQPTSSAVVAEPPPAAPAPAAPAPAAAAPAPPPAPSSPPAADKPAAPSSVPISVPPSGPDSMPPSSIRLSGEDLIVGLFEAFADLHFLRDALEGADFVLALTLEKLPCEAGLVSLFDINRREFVVVRQFGGSRSILLQRLPERAPSAHAAMRSHRACVFAEVESHPDVVDERWSAMDITPRSLVCAPVELGGRYLGLIELANPLDEQQFTRTDGHALTYIGQQFAEFVASRGIVLDPDHVLEYAKRSSR